MSDNDRRPIVIRRKKSSSHASHGAWKIAYADFMTAMMAFFLVMWLLAGVSDAEMENISEYFRTPLSVALAGGDKSSASNSAIPGGGDDPMHADGEVALTRPDANNYRLDQERLQRLKTRLENMIRLDPALESLRSQLKLDLVQDGLRIQIIDSKRRPMFELGSAEIEPYIHTVLRKIAPSLNELPNKVTLTGHTDDVRYASGDNSYSNWELSTDRANASRRALIVGGMDADKLLRVIGAAATMRLPSDPPGAAVNRRISILVLNPRAQAQIEAQGRADGGTPYEFGPAERIEHLVESPSPTVESGGPTMSQAAFSGDVRAPRVLVNQADGF